MTKVMNDKPPYCVPTMQEIRELPWNGYKVVSTFSGCGGSCLGYRMAGFRVLWANEFDAHARASYKPNHPDSILDSRNICDVKANDILKACHLSAGELDVLDGSPPCQTFSTAGKRNMRDSRTDLFVEYARILKGLQPRMFVAENVSGMAKGVAKGQFKITLRMLKECGYRVMCRLLDAQWLGVPQVRRRVIFIGIRNDLIGEPQYPKPLTYRYSVRDALPWISAHSKGGSFTDSQAIRSDPARTFQRSDAGPSRTLLASGISLGVGMCEAKEKRGEVRMFTIAELKCISSFPDDFQLVGSYAQQWARIGNSVPPVMMYHIAMAVRRTLDESNGS